MITIVKKNFTVQAAKDRKRVLELEAELVRVKSQRDEMIVAGNTLYSSFIHVPGNKKGNKAKTDIITLNDDVRAALTFFSKIQIWGYQNDASKNANPLANAPDEPV